MGHSKHPMCHILEYPWMAPSRTSLFYSISARDGQFDAGTPAEAAHGKQKDVMDIMPLAAILSPLKAAKPYLPSAGSHNAHPVGATELGRSRRHVSHHLAGFGIACLLGGSAAAV